MAKKLVLPRVHAMILCDDFEFATDEERVFHLYSVRTRIEVNAFPYSHPQLCVYLQLTGHPGQTNCSVAIIDPDADEEVISAPSQLIELTDPLDIVPVFFVLEDCDFTAPGLYYVQAFCDRKLVCERPLLVARKE